MILSYFQNLLESVIIISIFCTLYIAVFQKETTHKQNRLFLLFGIVLSLTLPFLEVYNPVDMPSLRTVMLNDVIINLNNITAEQTTSYSFTNILFSIYIVGTIFFIIRFLLQAIKINSFLKDSKVLKNNKVKIVYTNKKHSPFSFLNFIFIDKETKNSKNAEVILKHETVHVLQRHSIDLILFELLLIIQWFNPLVWIYGKKIKENHEFTVDNELIKNGLDSIEYQQILLSTNSSNYLFFTNNFNKSLTFKRLIMMTKNKSPKVAIFKLIAILPVLLASVYFVSCSENKVQNEEETTEKTTLKSKVLEAKELTSKENKEPVFLIVDDMPKFPGGRKALSNYIKKNAEYPKEAQAKGIQGRVFVKFIIEKDGSVSNVEISRSVHSLLDREALRLVKNMPKWTPGKQLNQPARVRYTVPINFQLQ